MKLFRKMLETATIYTKVNDTLFKNDGKYATKKPIQTNTPQTENFNLC